MAEQQGERPGSGADAAENSLTDDPSGTRLVTIHLQLSIMTSAASIFRGPTSFLGGSRAMRSSVSRPARSRAR